MHRVLTLFLCMVPLGAVTVVTAAAEPAAGSVAEEPFEQAEIQRLEAEYQHAVIAHHAGRSSARSQVIAAMLARVMAFSDVASRDMARHDALVALALDPRTSDARAMYQQALERGENDPLVLWLIANDNTRDDAGLAEAAAQQLTLIDPDNAAAWLALLQLRKDVLTESETDALLERAAAASTHRVYYAETVRLLADAYVAVPRSNALVALEPRQFGVTGDAPGASTAAYMRAFAIAMAVAIPSASVAACRSPAAGSERQATCLRLAALLSGHADTVMGRHVGFGTWERLTIGTPARAEVATQRRVIDWQLEAYGEVLQASALDGAEWARAEQEWMRPGRNEVDIVRAVLEQAGIALQPPKGFVSMRERWRKDGAGSVPSAAR